MKNGTKKLLKGRTGQTQGRLDNFFKVVPGTMATKRRVSKCIFPPLYYKNSPNFLQLINFHVLNKVDDEKSAPAKKAKGGSGRGRKPK